MQAIGMIETIGFLSAAEISAAVRKAANVSLYHKPKTDSGQISIFIRGDADAIQSAVEAGRKAGEKSGMVYCTHMMSCTHPELKGMLNSPHTISEIVESVLFPSDADTALS